jgi:putative NADH-flavin reductase
MRIVVIGATGFVGSKIVNELVERNHEVLGVSKENKTSDRSILALVNLDVTNVNELADRIKGFDIVVSAFSSGWDNPNMYEDFIKGSISIQEAVKLADVKRYIVIGGAGSLYVADNIQAVDTDEFPAMFKPVANAARDYFKILKTEETLDWAYFCPALEMHPGLTSGRTGKYRLGTIHPVINDEGRSILSVEDVAMVIADEIELPKHHQTMFTAAY